jgi:uncharacterized Fe-S radical SAM superfamily protein PflX
LSVVPSPTPAYLSLLQSGALKARVEEALDHLAACDLCPRYCRVDRRRSAKGALCHTGARAAVHSYGPHDGEEDPLRGTRGSGTIFFAWCNLRCVYCQSWEISQKGIARRGHLVLPGGLAGTAEVMRFLALEVSSDAYVNLMDQYHPCYRADRYPPLDRPPSPQECARALADARKLGLHRFDRPRRW